MVNLGDSPMYLMNGIGDNLANGLTGGSPMGLGILFFGILLFIILIFKPDRGSITLLGLLTVGVMLQLGIIPEVVFWALIAIVAIAASYGFLQSLRQGEG